LIVIYTPKVTNRIKFTLDFVFHQYFGTEIHITENPEIPLSPDIFYINYSKNSLPGFYQIFQHDLLLEEIIMPQQIEISFISDLPVFFQTSKPHDLMFDIFACIFYLISRYEEYLPHEKDLHGRYLASNSILSKKEFQFQPIVEHWLLFLKNDLYARHPLLRMTQHSFEFIPTFDIDNAFQYLGREWIVQPPNIFKPEAIKTLLRLQRDPYDIFDQLLKQISLFKLQPIFFFLVNNKLRYNSHVNPKSKKFIQLIQQITAEYEIGIHPSYHAAENNTLETERKYLEKISVNQVRYSRQHFLRIDFPVYYRKLALSGVLKDYSLGYPEVSGFRAGCSRPFNFFDVERNETSILQIQPCCFMDATFVYYQQEKLPMVYEKFLTVFNQVKKINGILVPIFHNDLLAVKLESGFYNKINQRIITEDEK